MHAFVCVCGHVSFIVLIRDVIGSDIGTVVVAIAFRTPRHIAVRSCAVAWLRLGRILHAVS